MLELSDAGRALLDRATPVATAVQDDILEGLSAAERDAFVALLRKATEAGNDHSRAPLVLPARAAPTD